MVLKADSVSLAASGPSLTFGLRPGESCAVYGRASSGKDDLLAVLAGLEKPMRGNIRISGSAVLSGLGSPNKRATALSIAQAAAGPQGAERCAEALAALGLWDVRKRLASSLSPEQLRLAELLPALASPAKLIAVKGGLDAIDPWTEGAVMALLAKRLRSGAALVAATNAPDLAPRMDVVVVMEQRAIAFAGSYADLERSKPQSEIVVETHTQLGVRNLVQPFEVRIEKRDDGALSIKAKEGQAVAAKLLAEGYGDVRATVLKRPSPRELLQAFVG